MNEPRRVAVMAPDGTKMVLVIDGSYLDGMEDGYLIETIPVEAVIAIEECPEDVPVLALIGKKPESQASFPSSDHEDSDPHLP